MRRRPPEAWIDAEPRFGGAVKLVSGRAIKRSFQAGLVAVVLSGVMLVVRLQRAPVYQATDYFRMVEGEVGDATPPPPKQIREYITSVALSKRKLVEIMTRYGIYRKMLAVDPAAAIDSMRDDIGVIVERNYFIYERRPDDEPRSASIAITYPDASADVAQKVVHDVAQAILDAQAAQRNSRLASEAQVIKLQLDNERQIMRSIQLEANGLLLEEPTTSGGALVTNHAQIAGTQQRLKLALDRVRILERRASDLVAATDVESRRLGISFQLVDEELEVKGARLSLFQIIRLAVVLFGAVGGVTFGVAGAWGRKIYSADDLVAAGVPVLGTIPAFPGDDAATYRVRSGKKKPRILWG